MGRLKELRAALTRRRFGSCTVAAAVLASLTAAVVIPIALGVGAANASGGRAIFDITTDFSGPPESTPFQQLVHPRGFEIASADATLYFKNLRWHGWGSEGTTARGLARWCETTPCHANWRRAELSASGLSKGINECAADRFYLNARYRLGSGAAAELKPSSCV